jgi:hypothetical protein
MKTTCDKCGIVKIPHKCHTEVKSCHCGKPLHYTDPAVKKSADDLIATAGEYVKIFYNGRGYKVPRHYVFLHGIKAQELPTLGFEEIKE